MCILDGDSFYYSAASKRGRENEMKLSECSIKLVHKVIAGRDRCFLLSSSQSNELFQAENDHDLLGWMGAITHAIDVAHGRIATYDRPAAFNAAHFLDEDDETNKMAQQLEKDLTLKASQPKGSHSTPRHRRHHSENLKLKTLTASPVCNDAMLSAVEKLLVLEHCNFMVDAIQWMRKYSPLRQEYWHAIFAWAYMDMPTFPSLERLVDIPLPARCVRSSTRLISHSDESQLQKDIPRTAQWLINSEW